jgi:nudix-type nucleoside diphosphatase (YffH/AdpP family)
MNDVKITKVETIHDGWASLRRYTILYTRNDGTSQELVREVHDHGNAAAVLPYDKARGTVLLVRQFRFSAFINGYRAPLIEACAGLLDGDEPEACARREAEEELGYRLGQLKRIGAPFMSPGAVTEQVTLFIADYDARDRIGPGGGHAAEGEDIEVIEMPFAQAFSMVGDGTITDAKTMILLLYLRLRLAGGFRP